MIRTNKPARHAGGGISNVTAAKGPAKTIVTDRGGRVMRYQTAKTPSAGATHPGLFISGRKARPTGFDLQAPRVIPHGSLSVAPPVTGAFKFF